ncbi:putative transposase of IS4/5 family (DUF4096) [Actinosynnema pretiosum]|nr:putative transposase of IS4/5 family (DUF4096) [Actinosynnema pretiosum]
MAAPWIVGNELWDLVEPLIPVPTRHFRHPGRKRLPARECLQGILFVLHTGIGWADLPTELGFGSGSTYRRRMLEWVEAGVWQRLHEVMLTELHAANRIDWSRAAIDSSHDRALKGALHGSEPGRPPQDRGETPLGRRRCRSPTDHRRQRGQHPRHRHTRRDGRRPAPRRGHTRTSEVAAAGAAHRPQLGQPGQPEHPAPAGDRPADRPTRTNPRFGPGRAALGVERTLSWLRQYRRLRARWDHRAGLHQDFLNLACALIRHRRLHSFRSQEVRPQRARSRQEVGLRWAQAASAGAG